MVSVESDATHVHAHLKRLRRLAQSKVDIAGGAGKQKVANEGPNAEALRCMLTFIPPDIRSTTQAELEAHVAATKASPQLGNGSARWKKSLRNNRKPRQWRPGSRVR